MAQQELAEDRAQTPDADERQMKQAVVIRYVLAGLGILALGLACLFGWRLLTLPWPFLGLPAIGGAAGVPWLLVVFVGDEQAQQMGPQAFKERLAHLGELGARWGAGVAALTIVLFLVMCIGHMWPASIL